MAAAKATVWRRPTRRLHGILAGGRIGSRWMYASSAALTRGCRERTKGASKLQKMKMGVALARKLLVALWRWVDAGVVIEGAVLKSAAKAS